MRPSSMMSGSGFFPPEISYSEKWMLGLALLLLMGFEVLAFWLHTIWIAFLPFGLFLAYVLVMDLRLLFFALVFLFPFSFKILKLSGSTFGMQIPTEPFAILLILFWIYRLISDPPAQPPGREESRPINLWLMIFIGMTFVSIIPSGHKIVTIKFIGNTMMWVLAFYAFARYELRETENSKLFLYLLFISADFIVIYSLLRTVRGGFGLYAATQSFQPFFTEHTSYGAYLGVMFGLTLPLILGTGGVKRLRVLAAVTSILVLIGIVFSYTRAAWMAVIAVVFFVGIIKAKEAFSVKVFAALLVVFLGAFVVVARTGVVGLVERHAMSVTNLQSNFSNLERISRWDAALRMTKAHPFLGIGFGAYPDEYQAYRNPELTTPIYYIHAGPHNDYLEYSAETGLFGLFAWLMFLFYLYRRGIKNYFKIKDPYTRSILLSCLAGVFTYLVQALVNDFLQFDKVAVPFWSAIAISVIIMEKARAERDKELHGAGQDASASGK